MQFQTSYSTEKKSKTRYFIFDDWTHLVHWFDENHSAAIWVIDHDVHHLHSHLFDALKNKIVLKSDEKIKSIENMVDLLGELNSREVDKKSIIVAIGGGALSDLVGFVASIFHRGISYAIIPTTLLSMIDASIGGKNGINFKSFKNQLGTIYQPSWIGIYPAFIDTLNRREIASGFAEIIKYGCILDNKFFEYLASISFDEFIENNQIRLNILTKCFGYKKTVISEDPFESEFRKILNFGHSFGHAIESLYELYHGEAIGLGMLIAIKISELELGLDRSAYGKLKSLLEHYQLPTRLDFNPDLVHAKIKQDKKREGDNIDFILLPKLGSAEIRTLPMSKIHSYLSRAREENWI